MSTPAVDTDPSRDLDPEDSVEYDEVGQCWIFGHEFPDPSFPLDRCEVCGAPRS